MWYGTDEEGHCLSKYWTEEWMFPLLPVWSILFYLICILKFIADDSDIDDYAD